MASLMQGIVWAGWQALVDYVATHVLTCLVPAFLLAGAMVSFIRREAVLRYLGRTAAKWRSYSLASGSSFLIAACSCTVIPVASGLYYAGAGVGAAFIVLWVAPAANILALVYTGQILGGPMVLARIAAALLMAFAVGLVMDAVFRKEASGGGAAAPAQGAGQTAGQEAAREPVVGRAALGLFALLVLTLLLPNYLVTQGPYLHKMAVWLVLTLLTAAYAWRVLQAGQIRRWLRETWWFVRMIFPLLLAGVFIVGVIGYLLPPAWIERWLSGNGLLACFLATLLGGVSYFATMTEAPFVDTLRNMGMGDGPALALLLTGPGISLPNWLAIARVFGVKKAMVYVPTIVVLGTVTGWLFGNYVL
jgi:uncharacterized protein